MTVRAVNALARRPQVCRGSAHVTGPEVGLTLRALDMSWIQPSEARKDRSRARCFKLAVAEPAGFSAGAVLRGIDPAVPATV